MAERPGEFRMSNIGIMKNYKLHRYPNAIRKPEIKQQFICHKVMACADVLVMVKYIAHSSTFY
jgi:hypothetical protein